MVGKRISSPFIWAKPDLCGSICLEVTSNSKWLVIFLSKSKDIKWQNSDRIIYPVFNHMGANPLICEDPSSAYTN